MSIKNLFRDNNFTIKAHQMDADIMNATDMNVGTFNVTDLNATNIIGDSINVNGVLHVNNAVNPINNMSQSVDASGNYEIDTTGGTTKLLDNTQSTSTSTGCLVLSGGAGIAGNEYVGGLLRVADSTASTSISTGCLVLSGGAGIAGNSFLDGTMTITNYAASAGVSTGAMVVYGGVGINGQVHVGDELNLYTGLRLPSLGGTASLMDYYEISTATYPTSGAVTGSLSARFSRLGDVCTFLWNEVAAVTATASQPLIIATGAVDTKFRPAQTQLSIISVVNSGTYQTGLLEVNANGSILFYATVSAGSFTSGGLMNISGGSITYRV